MYIPKYFRMNDREEIAEFIHQNGFGIVITTNSHQPIATHIPMQLHQHEDHWTVTGHIAYGNKQWRTWENETSALLIFQGAHAYVSSSWYTHENVPTWNYEAVHLSGTLRLLTGDELRHDLAKLMEKYEAHRENPVLWDTVSPNLLEKEIKGIVGFEVRVEDVQAITKMSQNRNEEDYGCIVEQLKKENHPQSKEVADKMAKRISKKHV